MMNSPVKKFKPMIDENSSKGTSDYKQITCSMECETWIERNQLVLNEFLESCSSRLVLAIINFNDKQLHLFGSTTSTAEAEKQFLELQNKLLVDNAKQFIPNHVHWWYEAWDGTWQLYDSRMTIEIEYHYKSKIFNFTIRNDIGEKVSIDLNKSEEIYGHRMKRILRSKLYEQQPNYWTLTPLNLERFVLDIQSQEYLSIKENFDDTMEGRYKTLISIERIQNLRLFKQFCISHEDFLSRHGQEDNGTMRYHYHGCPHLTTKKIIDRGFNRSYCGLNGCLYGRGVYFSTRAAYSDRYAIPNDMKEKRMFYSRVLVGRSMIGYSTLREPTDGYDSTTDGTHIFVCYYDSQCYPEYLLTYV